MSKKLIGIALAGASLVVCAAAPAVASTLNPGDAVVANDAFRFSFDAGGNGDVVACAPQPGAPCTYTGATISIAFTNVDRLGGSGFEFTLPQSVGGGIIAVLSGTTEVAAMDFGPLGQTQSFFDSITSDASVFFVTGLGALGLLGWRRKRKSRASLLGAV